MFAVTSLCLGLSVCPLKDGEGYSVDQKHYLVTVLKEFGMLDCKPTSTPMTKGEVNALVSGNTGAKLLDEKAHGIYQQIVGKLMYAMVGSRPDLAYALSMLGRYAAKPDTYHMSLAKRVLVYVRGTLDYKLYYIRGKKSEMVLRGHVDADWANAEDRKSTTGYCFFLENSLIVWCSKKQPTVATLTTVAEYIALYEATTESVCLRHLLSDLLIPQKSAAILRENNQTAIKLSEDEASHKRTKHIDVKYRYTREQQEAGVIRIDYIPTGENLADFFTKPLPHTQFIEVCKQLGLHQ